VPEDFDLLMLDVTWNSVLVGMLKIAREIGYPIKKKGKKLAGMPIETSILEPKYENFFKGFFNVFLQQSLIKKSLKPIYKDDNIVRPEKQDDFDKGVVCA
jgi:hypothetical protein